MLQSRRVSTSPPLSVAVQGLRPSVFARLAPRLAARAAAGAPVIPLQIGDTHRAPVAEALAAATATAAEIGRYGSTSGLTALRAALARHRRAAGLRAAASGDHVLVGTGCTHALFCAVRAVVDPGDEVLVASPFWPLVPGVLRSAGATVVQVPISQALARDGFDLDATLEAHRSARTRAIYFISPNNPDGVVWPRPALEVLAEFARRHDLWVLADEVYADYVYDGVHHHIADLPGMAGRTISTYSLSKSHGLAGARVGYAVATPAVVAAANRIANHTVYHGPEAMQRVALAAVTHGDDWIDAARASYREARDGAASRLANAGLPFRAAEGGSFLFVDLAEPLAGRPLDGLLERTIDAGVMVAPGAAMGEGYERHVRICFTGVPAPTVADGVARFVATVAAF